MPRPLFTFSPERYFLADIFNYLPDRDTDTQQLTLAVVHDDQYHESNDEFRTRVDSEAKPIDQRAFIQLLDTLETQLSDIMRQQGESLMQPDGPFRALPTEYLKTIRAAKEFLAENMNRELYLVVYQYPVLEHVHYLIPVRFSPEISASVSQFPMPSNPMLKL